jgi:hypothetical protein
LQTQEYFSLKQSSTQNVFSSLYHHHLLCRLENSFLYNNQAIQSVFLLYTIITLLADLRNLLYNNQAPRVFFFSPPSSPYLADFDNFTTKFPPKEKVLHIFFYKPMAAMNINNSNCSSSVEEFISPTAAATATTTSSL